MVCGFVSTFGRGVCIRGSAALVSVRLRDHIEPGTANDRAGRAPVLRGGLSMPSVERPAIPTTTGQGSMSRARRASTRFSTRLTPSRASQTSCVAARERGQRARRSCSSSAPRLLSTAFVAAEVSWAVFTMAYRGRPEESELPPGSEFLGAQDGLFFYRQTSAVVLIEPGSSHASAQRPAGHTTSRRSPVNWGERTVGQLIRRASLLGMCTVAVACAPSPHPSDLDEFECGPPQLPPGTLCFDTGPDGEHEGYFPAPVILARGRIYISPGLGPPVRRGNRVEFQRDWCWTGIYACGNGLPGRRTSAFFFDPGSRAVYRFDLGGRLSPLNLTRVEGAECETVAYPASIPYDRARCPSDPHTVVEAAPPCDDLEFIPPGPPL